MRPNNSFKPNLLRYTNNVAGKACHVVGYATQVGLTQALGLIRLLREVTMGKFTDIMFSDDLTVEELRALPKGQAGLWIMRPKRDAIDRAKYAMYFRAALIAAAAFYFFYVKPGGGGEASSLIAVVAMYEFAYYILRKEKCEQEYSLARESYVAKAREIDGEA